MKICNCGHTHCCHASKNTEIIEAADDDGAKTGRKFQRETCAECGQWISDTPV